MHPAARLLGVAVITVLVLEASLPRRLERRLAARSVEVVNLGVRAYSTAQEFLYLREEGLKYHPNLVLLGFYSNDFRENSRALLRGLAGSDADLAFARPFAALDDADGHAMGGP